MKLQRTAASIALAGLLSLTTTSFAQRNETSQQRHERAKAEQTARDHQNHTGAKIVGGSAAGGAVIGAIAGGGKGALIGGALGAGGGAIANKVRKDKAVKKRESRQYPR